MSRPLETLRAMAAGVIGRSGTALTLRRDGVPSYDPQTGLVTATTVDTNLNGVVDAVESGLPDGTVRRGDMMVTVAARHLAIEPAPGDGLIVAGIVYRVVSVTATYAGNRPAVLRLQVRR
jgi:hypothetical protein